MWNSWGFNLSGKPVSKTEIKSMTDAIAHRGPDGEGQWIDGPIGLGHRRLSIIDLSTNGSQPMVSRSGVVIVYNGEIYNFLELRRELESYGITFKSKTDTEVLLEAMEFWGLDAISKFNGMFAFALWDCKKQELLLARDRYGQKPLYYTTVANSFMFGSEQKAFTFHKKFHKNLYIPALVEYLTFQNIFTDNTLLEGVRLLPAGKYAIVKAGAVEPKIKTYWDYRFSEENCNLEEEEYEEELSRLFEQAVKRQLIGDVEVGSYLSGGIDSGAITATASRSVSKLKTFACGFDLASASGIELSFDERETANFMSQEFQTEHYEVVLKSGDMENCLPKLVHHLEEPRVGQSYPNFVVAGLASKFTKVVMSGSGGDELFGGYPWRYYRGALSKNFEQFIDQYYLYWQRLVDNSYLNRMLSPVKNKVHGVWTRDIFSNVFSNHDISLDQPEDYINHSLYFEAKTFLHGLLIVEDKLSMAHGLETRVPFLDNDLVDFALQCPVRLGLNNLGKIGA